MNLSAWIDSATTGVTEALAVTSPWVEQLGDLEPWVWGAGGATGLAALLAIRRARVGVHLRRLRRPLRGLPQRVVERLPWRESVGLVASATALDVLTAMIRIDPSAIEAIDRAHGAAAFDDFFALQTHLTEVAGRGPAAYEGLISQYKGALGESWAAEHLRAAGHEVDFASGPTQEAWDLWVDGFPLQVKSGLSAQGVADHLARHPEVPVVTVSDHADGFHDAAVGTLPWSGADVDHATRESLDAIEGAGDLSFELPVITLGMAAWRNHRAFSEGRLNADAAVVRTVAEVAAVGIGAKLGSTLGTFILPGIGTLVGGVIGALFGRSTLGEGTHLGRADQRRIEACTQALCTQFASFACDARAVASVRVMSIGRGLRQIRRGRTLLGRLLASRGDVAAVAAGRRLRQERRELRALIERLDRVRSVEDAARVWSDPMPVLAGLRGLDHQIRHLQGQLRSALRGVPAPRLDALLTPCGPRPWSGATGMPRTAETAPAIFNAWWLPTLAAGCVFGVLSAHARGLVPQPEPTPTDGTPPTASRRGARSRLHGVSSRTAEAGALLATRARCRLRAEASLQAPIVTTLDPETPCRLIAWDGQWAQSACEGQPIAFVHQDCLKAASPEP